MTNVLKSPLIRISFGLVMMTVTLLLISDAIGLIPDTRRAELNARRVIAESLAVQLSAEIAERNYNHVEQVLHAIVVRNGEINSAAIRLVEDGVVAEYGDHERHWQKLLQTNSTPEQMQIPIFNNDIRWGTVELSFKPLSSAGRLSDPSSFYSAVIFVGIFGFIFYILFLRRSLNELNPDSIIPDRVRKALDTLSEGLLIIDTENQIIFSNYRFAEYIGQQPEDLVGRDSEQFDWRFSDGQLKELPWVQVLKGKEMSEIFQIGLATALDKTYRFKVNASTITDPEGRVRGVLVTFDNISEIEKKNEELRRTFYKLEKSQREITRQNRELQILATRDSLSGLLNRRSLSMGFQTLFSEAQDEKENLSCIMVDIDFFKSINDSFGHAMGDMVIKLIAQLLTEHSRPNDLVGRYGGEEFLLVLPGVAMGSARGIAERIRKAIHDCVDKIQLDAAVRITASLGVSSMTSVSGSHEELLDQADKALYQAKETGRNKVVCWNVLNNGQPDTLVKDGLQAIDRIIPDGGKEVRSDYILPDALLLNDPGSPDDASLIAESDNFANNTIQNERIDQAIICAKRYGTHVAALVIDIDALHYVSDTLGHSVNQKIGKQVVSRLKAALRQIIETAMSKDHFEFSVSQLGFNKINVLLMGFERSEIVPSVLQQINAIYNTAVEVEGHEFYLNSHTGVSLYPVDGGDSDSLIRNACSAMREAKLSQGRTSFRFYDDEINKRYRRRIRLEAELHRAVERNELVLCYQPKIDLKKGKIIGMEALIRWQHPQLGMIPPDDFIPLAEQTGFIEEISRWVVYTACQQISYWQSAGYGTLNVAVNLSPIEFQNPLLGSKIIEMVQDAGIARCALEFEITETAVVKSIDSATVILHQLSEAGFGLSVDDFGTGYSSLSYLKGFPLSKVKIDRSFITGFVESSSDAAIVSAIIAMSHSLGLKVVAEGVETLEQLRFLQDLQCDEMQGYLISKPVSAGEVTALLSRETDIRNLITDYHNQPSASLGGAVITVLNDFPSDTHDALESEVLE
ncbi:EAL domain-containing protein [Amphritea balenae]|nr:EAL domain-containing protein [Amphritea balenae]GGK53948.1 hypothetical protein GCM10007941_00010 [Amphritea balenae]